MVNLRIYKNKQYDKTIEVKSDIISQFTKTIVKRDITEHTDILIKLEVDIVADYQFKQHDLKYNSTLIYEYELKPYSILNNNYIRYVLDSYDCQILDYYEESDKDIFNFIFKQIFNNSIEYSELVQENLTVEELTPLKLGVISQSIKDLDLNTYEYELNNEKFKETVIYFIKDIEVEYYKKEF